MSIRMEDTHVALIEQGVPPHEQTMTIEKPFWAFFSGNMLVVVWLLGTFITGFGLNIWQSISVIIIGNFIGCVPLGFIAGMGPKTRLSQIEASRLPLGKAGARLSGFLNWINCIGWDAINNVPAAAAFVMFLMLCKIDIPFWMALAILVIMQMLISICGHHVVQIVAKYVGWFFFAGLIIAGIGIIRHGIVPLPDHVPLAKDFVMALSLTIVGSLGYAPYISDYTRYLPAETPPKKAFWSVLLGAYLSVIAVETLGVLTASLTTDQTPTGLITAFSQMAGSFAPAVLLVVAMSSIPTNALNDNSGSYCLISAGVHIGRPISAVISAGIGFVAAAWGAGRYTEAFENYLLFLFYWMAPWTAIVLVHWFKIGRHQEEHFYSPGWTHAATIFVVTTIATIALFSASPIYTSPVAKALGGVDIGYYVGFIVAGLWYAATLKKNPNAVSNDP